MSSLPVICAFGVDKLTLKTPFCRPFETRDMDVRCHLTDSNLHGILAKDRPSAIISFGDVKTFKNLASAPGFTRKMWLHFDDVSGLEQKGDEVFKHFFRSAVFQKTEMPLVSVFTPAYKPGDKIDKPFRSLLAQTYQDWEWVIVDDSDDKGETFKKLSEMAEMDDRIRVYRESRPSGRIGTVKRTACGLARGEILVELDHDDELTPKALQWVVEAFQDHPEAGFVYTDFAECFEDGRPFVYTPGWGMGYGSYREEIRGGVKFMVAQAPNINPKTIRHIVAAPNHIRSWRKKVYDEIGGHQDLLHVVDDYELVIRTFLATRMVRISRMGYVQYRNIDGTGNTTATRNQEIQRLVRCVSAGYENQIHARLVELGIDDYMWNQNGVPAFYRLLQVKNPDVEAHCTITFDPVS
jgi:O-antigen biosynthesis protein